MAEKVQVVTGRYSPKGDKYKTDKGTWVPTLPRGRAGWQHILDAHEAKHEAKNK
jgi:hypothetical protein